MQAQSQWSRTFFSFKNKHIFPSLLCLQCWFSPVGTYCTISLLEDHKTQKELLGRWPQSSQHNAKCHSFPQAGILEKSSRLSETKAGFSQKDEWCLCCSAYNCTAHPRYLAAAIWGAAHSWGRASKYQGGRTDQLWKGRSDTPERLKDKKGKSFYDLSRSEPHAILFFSEKDCTFLYST